MSLLSFSRCFDKTPRQKRLTDKYLVLLAVQGTVLHGGEDKAATAWSSCSQLGKDGVTNALLHLDSPGPKPGNGTTHSGQGLPPQQSQWDPEEASPQLPTLLF